MKRKKHLMEAEVIPDGLRAEEDVSFSCHHQDKAVQCLQRQTSPSDRLLPRFYCLFIASVNNSVFWSLIDNNFTVLSLSAT